MSIFHSLQHATGVPWVVWSALVSGVLLLGTGLLVRRRIAATHGGLVPDEGVSVRNVAEVMVEGLANLAEQNMGPHWRPYFPLVGTIFFFILVSNLLGLVPTIEGSTSHASTTWGWAIISFVAHQYVGIREHGWSYVNHFLGPKLFEIKLGSHRIGVRALAPLYAPIELVSHISRVFTLAVRLLANMFADHTVVAVWLTLLPAVVPAVFMGLGMLVAFLQAFVFALLSMIYIGLALEEAH